MAATLGNIIADLATTLNLKVAVGATTATLDSATDDDGNALPTGIYFLTLDADNTSKEYIKCILTGTALTAIQSYSRQGALTTGFSKTHRKGASVKITDFGVIKNMIDALDGTSPIALTLTDLAFSGTTTQGFVAKSLTTTQRDALTPTNGALIYNTTASEFQIYQGGAWSTVSSGSTQPNASTTVAGKVEIATSAESIAGTDTGGTGALLSVLPSDIMKNAQSGAGTYGVDTGGDDTYVVALTPALTTYTVGQTLKAQMTTANTGACTIDFGPGAKSVKTLAGNDPADGDIASGKINSFVYDGTNLILQKPTTSSTTEAGLAEKATDAEVATGTDTERFTTPSQLPKYRSGTTTRVLSTASGNQTIAHGLGKVPKFVRIRAFYVNGSNQLPAQSDGTYDGTTNNCIYISFAITGGTQATNTNNSNIIFISAPGGVVGNASATVDATNITLAWTNTGGPSGTANIIWEAQT